MTSAVLTACTAGIYSFFWAGRAGTHHWKNIPYNVRSGLLTGTGIIIVWNQIPIILAWSYPIRPE